jgi:hypothetical protein
MDRIEVKAMWLDCGLVDVGDVIANDRSAPAEFVLSDGKPSPDTSGTMLFNNPVTIAIGGRLWMRSPMGNSYINIERSASN